MPRLDDPTLDALAQLARLDLRGADRAALRADLDRILTYVDRLAEVDIVDDALVPAGTGATGATAGTGGPVDPSDLRSDAVVPGLQRIDLQRLAPAWRDGRVEVPRTVDQDG